MRSGCPPTKKLLERKRLLRLLDVAQFLRRRRSAERKRAERKDKRGARHSRECQHDSFLPQPVAGRTRSFLIARCFRRFEPFQWQAAFSLSRNESA